VASGTLTAVVRPADKRYQQVSKDGVIKTGRCLSTPEVLPDGRLRLHEFWQWTGGRRAATVPASPESRRFRLLPPASQTGRGNSSPSAPAQAA
jgi:hypothetical protein